MRKLSVFLLLLLFVFPAGCRNASAPPAPASTDTITPQDVDAFLKGESDKLLEMYREQQ